MADNRTNEPTEAQVKAATQSLLEGADLEVFDTRRQEELRKRVRAALVAAQGAAPVLPSCGVDEEKLAEVIAIARNMWAIYGTEAEPLEKHVARAVIASRAEWLEGRGLSE